MYKKATKLFGIEYVQGYTAAVQDVLKTIDYIEHDLKKHKRKQNLKTLKAIVECILKNRIILREEPNAFIRCNSEGGYEVYIENSGIYSAEKED